MVNNRQARMIRGNKMLSERDIERRIEKIWRLAPVIWAIGFALSTAVTITIIWAIIKIVNHLT